MKIVEDIKEFEIKKTEDGSFALVIFKLNDKIYLENCSLISWIINNETLIIEYEHQNLPKRLEFKNIEKRTRYLINKNKNLSLCEIDPEDSNGAIIYTIIKNKELK